MHVNKGKKWQSWQTGDGYESLKVMCWKCRGHKQECEDSRIGKQKIIVNILSFWSNLSTFLTLHLVLKQSNHMKDRWVTRYLKKVMMVAEISCGLVRTQLLAFISELSKAWRNSWLCNSFCLQPKWFIYNHCSSQRWAVNSSPHNFVWSLEWKWHIVCSNSKISLYMVLS